MVRVRHVLLLPLLFIVIASAHSQNRIDLLTQSIIDTNSTPTTQALRIYNWITQNIKYDIKAFEKGEYLNLSPEELLQRKKGLCGDYSALFEAMCTSANIEAYTIGGYCKSYDYNKNKPFLRANHSWNVIYTDSSWKHVDCTWGGGYIYYYPPIYQRIAHSLFGTAVANSKSKYISELKEAYFDIPITSLIQTHYPLDPKWLLNPNPITIEQFQTDTATNSREYLNYLEEIERCRHKSANSFMEAEAINGKKYNPNNGFDLANVYFNKGIHYNLSPDITKENKSQFDRYLLEQTSAIDNIDYHKYLLDSIYKARNLMLKDVGRAQKRLTGRIKSKTKKAQKTHKSSQKKIVGKSSSYNKKMGSYQVNIGRIELKRIPDISPSPMHYTDTNDVTDYKNELKELNSQLPLLLQSVDSLFAVVDNFALQDAMFDDSIAQSNQMFSVNIDTLFYLILMNQEEQIINYVDSLKLVYANIEDFLSDKKTAKKNLQNTGRAYYSTSASIQKNLRQQLTINSKLRKIANDADSLQIAYNKCVDNLIFSYETSIVFTKKLANHNNLQADIRQWNLKALKHHKKNINKENKYFTAWYSNHMAKEKTQYSREKEIVKLIKSTSARNKKLIETKLKNFE